jgi:hypothetical protein
MNLLRLSLATCFVGLLMNQSLLSAENSEWDEDVSAVLKRAEADGRPVLLLVRALNDIASLDAWHWLREDSLFSDATQSFHCVSVWRTNPALKVLLRNPRNGLVFFTSKGELVTTEDIPLLRSELHEKLQTVLKNLFSVEYLRQQTSAELAKGSTSSSIDTRYFQRAIEVFRRTEHADEALPLQRVLNGLKLLDNRPLTAEETFGTEVLEMQAPAHKVSRIETLARIFDDYKQAKLNDDRAKPEILKTMLGEAGAFAGKADTKVFDDAKVAVETLVKDPKAEAPLKAAREALGKVAAALRTAAEPFKKETAELNDKFNSAYPDSIGALFSPFLRAVGRLNNEENEKKARELFPVLLDRKMKPQEFADIASFMLWATIYLDMENERAELLNRIEKDLPRGRHAADVYLDAADWALATKGRDAADKLWKAAENAAKDESPVLYRAARQMRAQLDPDSSPNKSKWAEREVLDVVVLAPDFESYAHAIAQWTDKEFFPVLLQDDIYAPKFIAAFKPAKVIVMPSGHKKEPAPGLPSIETMRRILLQSWTQQKEKLQVSEKPDENDLRARLEKVGAKPAGLVFCDGESGEVAGALALAAGRFQGLEILPRQEVGTEHHIGSGEHYMSQDVVWSMNNLVVQALQRWGLPYKERWAYITLAGNYPFRYFGEPAYGYGTTYALDDFLGRDSDGTRLGVTTRLMGDQAMSSYQAMCSLFLQPESAFLFNTYGTNPKSEWGTFRQSFAEEALKARIPVTHYYDNATTKANIDTFRAHVHPWNREGLIMINSSGYPIEWSVGNGPGTTEDFPIGVPCAIHIVHSGSAAALYENTENIAYRALWGGAFWYLGSTAEPFLDAFQPPFIAAPRMAAGVPLTACFRQRSSQNRWYPWRLAVMGDAQFCLRDKPAKRKAYNGGLEDAGIASGAPKELTEVVMLRKDVSYEHWLERLAAARQGTNPGLISATLERLPDPAKFDGRAACMILEELLKADRCAEAVQLWSALSDDARKNYAAQVYARYAAGRLMDLAQEKKDLDQLLASFSALLTTNPARNYVDRWNGRIDALAKETKADEKYVAWLSQQAKDKKYGNYQSFLFSESLKHKKEWTAEDKAAALEDFAKAVRGPDDEDLLERPFKSVSDLYMVKVPNATAAMFLADARALFKEDSREAKRITGLLRNFELNSLLHKDWLILGSFKDAAVGAWEKVGPQAGKTEPDFSAKFDEKRPIAWQRPFKPTDTGIIDLAALLKPNRNCFAYAAVNVEAARDCEGLLLLGSDDGVTAWLDGKEIHRNPAERGVKIDEDKVPVKLSAGKHSLVLRIDQGGGGWGFCARFAEKDEKAPLAGVKMVCPPLPQKAEEKK